MQKKLLDFGDLDPISGVMGGKKNVKNALSALFLLKGWIDFNQTLGDAKECDSSLGRHVNRATFSKDDTAGKAQVVEVGWGTSVFVKIHF